METDVRNSEKNSKRPVPRSWDSKETGLSALSLTPRFSGVSGTDAEKETV